MNHKGAYNIATTWKSLEHEWICINTNDVVANSKLLGVVVLLEIARENGCVVWQRMLGIVMCLMKSFGVFLKA